MKLSYLRLLMTSVLLVLSSWAFSQKTYVVAVGLTDYKYPEICPPVGCCIRDARSMANYFHDYNGSEVFMLLNKNATRSHILKVLKTQFSKSSVNDEVIFVFCGHGVQGGLTCYETRTANDIISYNEIQDIMKSVKARRKVILAMACYSGGLTKKSNNNNPQQHARRKVNKTNVMLYTSSRADEPSWARDDMKNSFFINRILRAFNGDADKNGDGKVTARELFNYVNPNVIKDTSGAQHPQMWGNFDDSMVVVYVK